MVSTGLVSVVVPTRDRWDLLRATLVSVERQQDVEIQVIVVDDGSQRTAGEMLDGLDGRAVVVRRERSGGVSRARNDGVAAADGEWIAFVDDDDVWAPGKLAAQLAAARRSGAPWACCGSVNVNGALRVLGGAPPLDGRRMVELLPHRNVVPGGCSGVVVHRDALPARPFDTTYRHHADWDLWNRLAQRAPPAVVARPLVGYRIHDSNASLDTVGMEAELDLIEERYGGPVDRATFDRHLARVSQRGSRRWDAVRYYARAAARRDASYGGGAFARDLAGVGVAAWRDALRRLGATPSRTADGVDPWRAAAQAWLDDLAGALDHAQPGWREP